MLSLNLCRGKVDAVLSLPSWDPSQQPLTFVVKLAMIELGSLYSNDPLALSHQPPSNFEDRDVCQGCLERTDIQCPRHRNRQSCHYEGVAWSH